LQIIESWWQSGTGGSFSGLLSGIVCTATLAAAPVGAADRELQVGDSHIELHSAERMPAASDSIWQDWIGTVAESLVSVTGQFPESHLEVHLHASRDRNPVAFGRVRRSDPPQVHLYVHPQALLDPLLDDWRGFHEFAHLLLPFVGNDDIWFAEGLAAYYQHLLQVRAGVIDADEAWRRMFAGFQRGLDDPSGREQTLRELSPRMWRERAFRRIHWTGAAYFLRVDVRLRQASDGEQSVDSALAAFVRCCRDMNRSWNARQLIERLDRLGGTRVWREEYQHMIDAPAEPDLDWTMNQLGIEWRDGEIDLAGDPQSMRLRAAIAAKD